MTFSQSHFELFGHSAALNLEAKILSPQNSSKCIRKVWAALNQAHSTHPIIHLSSPALHRQFSNRPGAVLFCRLFYEWRLVPDDFDSRFPWMNKLSYVYSIYFITDLISPSHRLKLWRFISSVFKMFSATRIWDGQVRLRESGGCGADRNGEGMTISSTDWLFLNDGFGTLSKRRPPPSPNTRNEGWVYLRPVWLDRISTVWDEWGESEAAVEPPAQSGVERSSLERSLRWKSCWIACRCLIDPSLLSSE